MQAQKPQCSFHPAPTAATQPFGASPLGRAPRAGHRGEPQPPPQGHCCSAGGWEGRTYSHPVSRFQNHSSSPPSVSSQHPGGKELTPTD